MNPARRDPDCSRRLALKVACGGAALVAMRGAARAEPSDEAVELVARLTGTMPVLSDRVRLTMPHVFPNGYTVPLAFDIDSAMSEREHVKYVRVIAPKNPLIEVATFHFTPGRSQARATTRIRLAAPQFVIAVAAMNDGALLMAKTWVEVASNGCK